MHLLSDTDRTAIKSFGVYDAGNDGAWPAIFILEPGGKVAFRSITDDYKKRPKTLDLLAFLDK